MSSRLKGIQAVTADDLQKLYIPPPGSHKGQNGRLLVIGGSHLFHAASLWALTVASRIVDLVHYCSVPENNELVQKAKAEFKNGIVVSREEVGEYIEEDDCILIGPGMTRDRETKLLTDNLLTKYPHKQWVIDAGALQMMDLNLIPVHAILTPHRKEFDHLTGRLNSAEVGNENLNQLVNAALQGVPFAAHPSDPSTTSPSNPPREDVTMLEKTPPAAAEVSFIAKKHNCILLLKGEIDIVCSGNVCRTVSGGNAGMTKGGTGDVLAGLVAALACNNDPFLAATAGSFINKAAGDRLYQTVGPYFNATDLAGEIPRTMKQLLLK